MATQNALIVTEIGKPVIKTTRLIPTPNEHQLLVKIITTGLNNHDQKVRDLGLYVTTLPVILSLDVLGTVVALGAEVKGFKVGDKVFGQANLGNDAAGLQQYNLLDSRVTGHMPSGFSDDEVVTLPICTIAPFVALFHSTGFGFPAPFNTDESKLFDYASKTIVVLGGGANCGKLAIQFASLVGIGNIIAVASLSNEAELKSYGATHIIDRHASNEDIYSKVHAVTDDVLYVIDVVNADHTFAVSLLSSTKNGKVVTLRHGHLDESKIGEKKAGYRIEQILGDSHTHREALGHQIWQYLPRWVESGKIKPLKFHVIEGGLNADGVNKVLDDYRDGKNPGKWNVHPNT